METHFYTTEIFFSFMRIFLYTFRNIPYNFFNLFSYFQNNECKKSRNSRGKTRAMESHFYSMEFFFSFTRIFQNTFRNIPYNFFFMLFSYFQNNECKKISKFEREDKSNGIPLVQHGFFFSFHENFPIFIQKLSLQFFIIVCSYFQNNECKEISKFEREDKGNGIPLLHHSLFFSFTTIFL